MPKTVKSWWWIALALVVVGSATLAHHAPPARAQSPRVTVEFWHGLAMPLGGHPREDRRRLQRVADPVPGQPDLQGLVSRDHGRGDRRVPRGQRAARRADVRGGHRDHDVGARGDQAGARADEGDRGRVRSRRVPALGGRLLQPARRPDDGDAVQQLDHDHVLQQGRLQEGGARSRASRRRPGPTCGPRPRRSARPTRRRAASPPRGPRGRSSSSSARSTTSRSRPRPTASPGSTRSSRSTARCTCATCRPSIDMQKEGSFKYGGRDAAGDALFPSGECAIIHASSGLRARIAREAKFEWGAAMLPYYRARPTRPRTRSSAAPPSG